VRLEFEPAEEVEAQADSRGIYRVLLNLATNALDACERKGEVVSVRAYVNASGCYIEVKDDGVGIAPELLPKLSQAFVSTKGASGTGLGLACSYKLVRDHGGEITVASKSGEGATFTVFLPARLSPGQTHAGKRTFQQGAADVT